MTQRELRHWRYPIELAPWVILGILLNLLAFTYLAIAGKEKLEKGLPLMDRLMDRVVEGLNKSN